MHHFISLQIYIYIIIINEHWSMTIFEFQIHSIDFIHMEK